MFHIVRLTGFIKNKPYWYNSATKLSFSRKCIFTIMYDIMLYYHWCKPVFIRLNSPQSRLGTRGTKHLVTARNMEAPIILDKDDFIAEHLW
jgi:hypothetical protein